MGAFSSAYGQIYVIRRKDGSTTYTSQKPRAERSEIFKPHDLSFSIYAIKPLHGRKLLKNLYNDVIEAAARLRGVDVALIKAVIHAESGFDPYARSPKGAMGLMQLMPDTAQLVGVRNPFQAEDNIMGGTTYLASLIERYNGDLHKSIAAYNAGPNNVDIYKGIPPFRETQSYVKRVLELRQAYKIARG